MQGIIVTRTGDIWAVDQGKSQVVHLPGGDPAKARIYCQNDSKNPLDNPCGLFAPVPSGHRPAGPHLGHQQHRQLSRPLPCLRPDARSRSSRSALAAAALPSTARAMSGSPNRFGSSQRGAAEARRVDGRLCAQGREGGDRGPGPRPVRAEGGLLGRRQRLGAAPGRLPGRLLAGRPARGWPGPGPSRSMATTMSGSRTSSRTRRASCSSAACAPRPARPA